jgi:ferredoxin
MTFIIAEPCIGTCDTACVDVCPVDCIHGPVDLDEVKQLREDGSEKIKSMQLFIDPDVCIDCGACEPECSVEAIFEEDDVPEEWEKYIAINADFFE